jgi:hypothetical protein
MGPGELEEGAGYLGTDYDDVLTSGPESQPRIQTNVSPNILGAGDAASVSVESGQGREGADFDGRSEQVSGGRGVGGGHRQEE